ncbi:Sugar or nucleoside kinase, ribokinase family [Fulvimarina manganoxydans]|uniref:Sugar or nucleoside kinase, ribokinase family n=1 Tax=Fulvimarina manganoxydans TaxID=937218 RepID=A0A1W2DGG1_9HYPH|nr:sugar kinase [Fulvimarina manganoxydans]SMC96579.1 Sugar or nucleoside kinase, ribokinase family [Fulvimarina manganoxydans]
MVSAAPLSQDSLGPTICVGEILVEIMARSVGDGFREPIDLVGPFASGAPAIFIGQCAKIGGSAGLIGAVGRDDFGRLNLDRLKADGADISAIVVDDLYPTGSAFVRYRSDGSRDFVYNIATSAAARFGWSEAVETLVHRAGHLHVMGSALSMGSAVDVIERALPIIKARGGSLSFDPNLRKEIVYDADTERRFRDLVAAADLLLPSGEELERAAGVEGEDAAIRRLFEMDVKEIALKCGAAGAKVFRPGAAPIFAAAFVVDEIDPTGAGDCFGGAYVASRRLGLGPEEALTIANAAGARNVTRQGPMEGAGTREELGRFIAETARRSR